MPPTYPIMTHAGALEAQVGDEEQLVEVMHQGLAARTTAGVHASVCASGRRGRGAGRQRWSGPRHMQDLQPCVPTCLLI
jgi:hypothetical protein